MPSARSDKEFGELMHGEADMTALDNAISWIQDNLTPADVFTEKDLETWAEVNGWEKSE